MIFGISDSDLLDNTKLKIINGIAGSGKSTSTVKELERLNEKFVLSSFSNALKFAAADRFNCNTDTICGLCFINTPYPRSEERAVTEFDTVILDEILLDGLDCLNWIKNNIGKVNIIALTDSRQMLSAENSEQIIKAFNKLCKLKKTVYVELTETKRARTEETKQLYNTLFNINSRQIFTVNQVQQIFNCDIIPFSDINFNNSNTYICHSNIIEHEVYKRFDLSNNRNNTLIPKNHIARSRNINFYKYPICDQITATDKKLTAYLQQANVATPTRFQGKEVEKSTECYFIIEENSMFTGREIYTVGTRCQDIKSLHLVTIDLNTYTDPLFLNGLEVVEARRLNIPDQPDKYNRITPEKMDAMIKQYGKPDTYYHRDIITSGDNIIFSTLPAFSLAKFADVEKDGDNYKVHYVKRSSGAKKSIHSIVKKDTTMHFDFMPKVYEKVNNDIYPPRINNKRSKRKDEFERLCDLYSAFPTILHNAPMPKAGLIYDEYDKDLLNFYVYHGKVVTTGSLITEELAKKLGNSEYVFSTSKQTGCELGHYTYEQCHTSKEKKAAVNANFLWGILESDFYRKEYVTINGEPSLKYVKYSSNTLELVSCALWSALCAVMLDAISSINAKDFLVVTDGLYYNGDKRPDLPDWCDYRIENKELERLLGKDENKKYDHIEYKTYEDLPSDAAVRKQKSRAKKLTDNNNK